MKDGDIVEHGRAVQVFDNPKNTYTQTLLSAALG
jgi:ABC-type microcin C transport system duplicated ATPase subunit YejF